MEDAAADITIPFLETLGYTMGQIQLILPTRHVSASDLLEYAFAVEEDFSSYFPLEDIIMQDTVSTASVSFFYFTQRSNIRNVK